MWSQYAELGLLGLPFAEQHGGFGGGGVETMLVMEAFGRALALEPYLATIVLAGTALRLAGNDAQQAALLPQVAAGEKRLAFAHGERQARYDLPDVLTKATPQGRGLGHRRREKRRIARRQRRHADRQRPHRRATRDDTAGITLFLVDGAANGVARRGYALRDGTRAAEITLSGVEIGADAVLGEIGGGVPGHRARRRGRHRGDGRRGGRRDGDDAGDDAGIPENPPAIRPADRPQPGLAAPRHRDVRRARTGAQHGDAGGDDDRRAGCRAERARNISMVKAGIGQAARFVSQNAVQLHGGIGMTEEYAVGHYFRRVMVIEHTFGDTAHHLSRLAQTRGVIAGPDIGVGATRASVEGRAAGGNAASGEVFARHARHHDRLIPPMESQPSRSTIVILKLDRRGSPGPAGVAAVRRPADGLRRDPGGDRLSRVGRVDRAAHRHPDRMVAGARRGRCSSRLSPARRGGAAAPSRSARTALDAASGPARQSSTTRCREPRWARRWPAILTASGC